MIYRLHLYLSLSHSLLYYEKILYTGGLMKNINIKLLIFIIISLLIFVNNSIYLTIAGNCDYEFVLISQEPSPFPSCITFHQQLVETRKIKNNSTNPLTFVFYNNTTVDQNPEALSPISISGDGSSLTDGLGFEIGRIVTVNPGENKTIKFTYYADDEGIAINMEFSGAKWKWDCKVYIGSQQGTTPCKTFSEVKKIHECCTFYKIIAEPSSNQACMMPGETKEFEWKIKNESEPPANGTCPKPIYFRVEDYNYPGDPQIDNVSISPNPINVGQITSIKVKITFPANILNGGSISKYNLLLKEGEFDGCAGCGFGGTKWLQLKIPSCNGPTFNQISTNPNPWPQCVYKDQSFSELRGLTNNNPQGSKPLYYVFFSTGANKVTFNNTSPIVMQAGATPFFLNITYTANNDQPSYNWSWVCKVYYGAITGLPIRTFSSGAITKLKCTSPPCCNYIFVDPIPTTVFCLEKGEVKEFSWKLKNNCSNEISLEAIQGLNTSNITLSPSTIQPGNTSILKVRFNMPNSPPVNSQYHKFQFYIRCNGNLKLYEVKAGQCCNMPLISIKSITPARPSCGGTVEVIFKISQVCEGYQYAHKVKLFYNKTTIPNGWIVGSPQPPSGEQIPNEVKYKITLPSDSSLCTPNKDYNLSFTFEYQEDTNSRKYISPRPFYILIKTAP